MRRLVPVSIVCVALATVLAVGAGQAQAEDPLAPWAPPVFQAAGQFSTAWTNADGATVQGLCTPQLWNRLSARFAGTPAAGSLGQMRVVQSGNLLEPELAWVHIVCVHPDGVQDVMTLTLVKSGAQWKVAGGPCGRTGS